jgi:hypothetical protein
MKSRLEYLLLIGFSRLVCALSLEAALTLGRAFGIFLGRVVRYRRKVAREYCGACIGISVRCSSSSAGSRCSADAGSNNWLRWSTRKF